MDDRHKNRHPVILGLFVIATMVLIFKALQLQVLDNPYRTKGETIAVDKITTYPSRGLIYDRNGKLMVYNDALYDLMVTYNQINPKMDTVKFCRLLDMDKATFIKKLEKNWRSGRYSKRKPFIFLSKISALRFTKIQENLYEFPGFDARLRNIRGYPYPYAAHLLGYLREVNQSEIDDEESSYSLGDYIGATGIEYSYEKELRGNKGARFVLKDKFGREVEAFDNNSKDVPAVSGADLITTIDIELQGYCEELMQNKRGSIVALDPKSGEVLSILSAPSYNPKLVAIGNSNRGKNIKKMYDDPLEPFFDRAVMAKYPPGSIFKTVVGLIAMEEEIIDASDRLNCRGYYQPGGPNTKRMCHNHELKVDLPKSLQHSCNTYYWRVFRDIVDQYGESIPEKGLSVFNDYLDQFGIGNALTIDYPREKSGNNPKSDFYNKLYKQQKWRSGQIMSVGIGQGEIEMTTLQMANLAAIISNKGHYYIPHIAKAFTDTTFHIPARFKEKKTVKISPYHFDPVIDGMERVLRYGTAQNATIPGVAYCGKTGTSQNAGKDHSIFFAFAPKENPQIALAVYIENGGFGATYAAPIASLVVEKYLNKEIQSEGRKRVEKRMMEANLIKDP